MKIVGFSTAALCAAVFFFALLVLPPSAERLAPAPVAAGTHRPIVAGAFHVHTTKSDGTGIPDQIAAAARRAGLQFVVTTDHGDGTRQPDAPAYRSGVLCIDGVEISTATGHYAAIGMRPSPYPLAGEARDVVEDVTRLGGFGIAAHPESPKAALRWRDWVVPFDGVEWLNADSEWRDETRTGLARVLLAYPFRPPEALASMFSRPVAALAHWDALTRQRRVVALAAADAHARIGLHADGGDARFGASIEAPSYETAFRTFAIRLQLDRPLTGSASADAMTVRSALAAGHLYSAIDALATPAEFDFVARSGPYFAHAGDSLALGGPVDLEATVNAPGASLVLFENGRPVAEGRSPLTHRAAERTAVFRVEARLPSAPGSPPVPWIVSNPVYVGGFLEPRRPLERPEPTTVLGLASSPGVWVVERDPRSNATIAAEPTATTFSYTLAGGRRSNQYAALVRTVNGLAAFDRLQFRARADRPMRVSVQGRLAGEGGDSERWQRSVYLDQEPRDITLFLDDFRPIGRTSTWQPKWAAIGSLLFVVDTANTLPGASGSVRFEDVRLASAR